MDQKDLASEQFLSGGGEMGALIRSMDWSKNPLGPIENWPQSLRTSVSLCLSSTFPILIAWGPETIQIYNDAYRPICGAMHPQSMGMNFRICWESALEVVGDKFTRGQQGEGTYIKDQQMFLYRYGYLEEAFMTFSFAPIRDESGNVGGIFHPITETTDKMLSARRTQVLRDVATLIAKAKSVEEIGRLVSEKHHEFTADLPFLLFYSVDADGETARLISSAGLANASALENNNIKVNVDAKGIWPLSSDINLPVVLENLNERFGDFTCEPYPEAPHSAVILPVFISGKDKPAAFVIAGVSSRRAMDEEYLGFYTMLGNTFSTAVSNVYTYEQEQKRAEALAAIDKSKTAFFSNVSHEFRTPLTLMLGPLEDLLAHPITADEQVKETLNATHRNAMRLLKLVNNLLDFSRVEAGRIKAAYQPIDIVALTTDLASSFRSIIEKADMYLVVESGNEPIKAYVDLQMWEKIVLNLLSNAFKYTLEGGITLKLKSDGAKLILSIEDTGVGIPESELPHMFERFHRVENSAGRTHEGTGIGLSLVSELVGLHGGSISVESTLGKGSVFTLNIPLGYAHLPAEQVKEKNYQASNIGLRESFLQEASGLVDADTKSTETQHVDTELKVNTADAKVLIVDDNADMRDYLQRLLAQEYAIYTATNGADALEQLKHITPDLILSDIMMPVLDGKGLLKKLREKEEKHWIPLIFLSARAGQEARIDGLEAGADDYLVKPFSGQELLSKVRAQIKIHRVRLHNEQRMRDFIAVATHELKTPLTALSGYAQIIGMKSVKLNEPALVHAAERARYQVTKMAKLVDDLLDVSKLDEGMLRLNPESFDMTALIKETIGDVQSTSPEHEFSFEHRESHHVIADREKIAQVLTNLFVNAVKYAPRSPKIEVSVTHKDGKIVTSVRDFGVGIKKEEMPHVFRRFYRTDSAHKGFRGFGVGLYLCAEIISRHGGEIGVDSEVSKGSVFHFSLPK
ncbi:cell wall metabolism sensor histidine kinase WalK [Pedobacter sp. Leaf132]|uniref:sensor histidine kinase n=1 Tax=Pedobacter sp. Leaf132 TaxID=2876557 RepID=UPI001E578CC5|nr:ATP-binding protein [Pedobacter sp. Leaf132]